MVYNYGRRIISVVLLLASLLVPVMVYASEKVEVSIPGSGWDYLGSAGVWSRLGQRLTINGTIYKIGYRVWKMGSPTGNITFSLYDAGTDEILFSRVWGDASQLNTLNVSSPQFVEVSPPLRLDREVRLCVEYYGGNETNYCQAGYYTGDKIAGQWYTNYTNQWHDIGEAEEGSYYLSYIPVASPLVIDRNEDGLPGWLLYVLIGVGAILATFAYVYFMRRQKSK